MKPTLQDIARETIEAGFKALDAHGLAAHVKDFPQALLDAVDERAGIITVTVVTPTGDSGELKKEIVTHVKAKTGKDVHIIEKKDPEILGGAIITYGDTRIDLSLKDALKKAKSALVA